MSQRQDDFPDDPRDGRRPGDPDRSPDPLEQESHDWLRDTYPLVDADFVGDTLDRVIHDRSEIESDAASIDEEAFAPELLDAYPVPAPRADFVDATLRRVMDEKAAGRRFSDDAAFEFHRLLESAQVPEPRVDFVDATLRAVLEDRAGAPRDRESAGASSRTLRTNSSDQSDQGKPPIPISWGRRFSLVASVAAMILCSVLIFWPEDRTNPLDHKVPALTVTPVAWAALVSETEPATRTGRFVLPDVDDPNPVDLFGSLPR